MKFLRKSFVAFIALVICVTPIFACSKKPVQQDPGSVDQSVISGTTTFAGGGKTDYKIVMSVDADDEIKFAAEELNFFTGKITGAKLNSLSDNFAVYSESSKYIVLGKNKLTEKAGIDPGEELGRSGFVIKSVGDMVFITGSAYDFTNYGTIQGVYEFLKYTFGLKIFAGDAYTYDEAPGYNVPIFNLTYIPDFDRRWSSYYFDDKLEAMRMGQTPPRQNDTHHNMTGHSQFFVLSQTNEYLAHPDWITGSGDLRTLCYSARDMYPVFARNLINLLEANPLVNRAFLGVPDMVTQCTCDRCIAMMSEYNTNHAGLMMIFFKEVLDIVVPYFNENYPDRFIEFATYAYEGVLEPPVDVNEETGEITPDHPAVMVHPSLKIQVAVLRINNMYSLTDTPNSAIYNIFKGWSAISGGRLECYLYHYLLNTPPVTAGTFLGYEETFRVLKDLGVYFFYEEGPLEPSQFAQLQAYVQSQLLRDTSLRYNDLAYEFCDAYYGPAGDTVKDIFDYVVGFYAANRANMPGDYATSANTIYSAAFSPRDYLETQITLFNKAEAELEPLKATDPELYETYLWRLRKDEFAVREIRLETYASELPTADVIAEVEYIRDWFPHFRHGRGRYYEGARRESSLDDWFDKLLAKLN